MIAMRFAALTVTTLLMLAAFGATSLQPSAFRVAVTAIIGLVAPLFWPGAAPTPARTALRIAAWALATAGLAATMLLFAGNDQTLARIVPACAMLVLVLLATLALAASIERHWRYSLANSEGSRERAARTAVVALAVAGSLPLWLGPAAELLAPRQPWLVDAVIGASPLTHLAVASGNDLLRNPWFYQHANLAALRFSYPGPATIILFYGAVALMLAAVSLASRRLHRRAGNPPPSLSAME
jgi:hypothetical protein